MKKNIFKYFLLFIIFLATKATKVSAEDGVHFLDINFQEAVNKAKSENKYLFIDCFTTWCGPCKMMAKDVFTQKKVGDYINENFISIKIDMEKPQGKEFKKQYIVNAYPTFLFLDSLGKQIHKIVGSMPTDEFITKVKSGMNGENISAFYKRFEKGERDDSFLEKYYKILSEANMSKESREVADIYLEDKTEKLLDNNVAFNIFKESISSPYKKSFKYFWKNKELFTKKLSKWETQGIEYKVWCGYGKTLINKPDFKVNQLDSYIKEMKKEGVKNYKKFGDINYMIYYEKESMWKQYVKLMKNYSNNKNYDNSDLDMLLYNWALSLEKKCNDKDIRKKATSVLEKRMNILIKAEEKEKAERKKMPKGTIFAMSMVNYTKSYSYIISKLNNE